MTAPASPLAPRFVDIGDRRVHLWEAGSGAPALLLHGFSDDGSCWASTAARFTSLGRRVVAPDARGHGRTPLLAGDEFTAAGRLADVERLAKVLELGNVVVVGHSMGAVTAMHLAADRPDLVRATVLIDPPLTGRELDGERNGANPFEEWVREVAAMEPAELADLCRLENPNWTHDEVMAWVSSKRAVDVALFDRRQSWHGRSWRSAIESIEGPTIIIAGEPELGSAVDSGAGRWLDRCQGVEFARIPGAGHSVHRDQRERFAELALGFLARSTD